MAFRRQQLQWQQQSIGSIGNPYTCQKQQLAARLLALADTVERCSEVCACVQKCVCVCVFFPAQQDPAAWPSTDSRRAGEATQGPAVATNVCNRAYAATTTTHGSCCLTQRNPSVMPVCFKSGLHMCRGLFFPA